MFAPALPSAARHKHGLATGSRSSDYGANGGAKLMKATLPRLKSIVAKESLLLIVEGIICQPPVTRISGDCARRPSVALNISPHRVARCRCISASRRAICALTVLLTVHPHWRWRSLCIPSSAAGGTHRFNLCFNVEFMDSPGRARNRVECSPGDFSSSGRPLV